MDITQEADQLVTGLQEQMVKMALQGAERAHHKYEQDILNGKRDDEWAAWYATFLKTNTEADLFSETSVGALELALIEATKEQTLHKEYSWDKFTANYIVHYILR